MTNIVFSPEAGRDIAEIGDYIAFKLRNKSAARGLISRIRRAILSLEQFPESGTPLSFSGPNFSYRYLVCGSHLIFYHFPENVIRIDRILYGRRDYLSILFGEELQEENAEQTDIGSG